MTVFNQSDVRMIRSVLLKHARDAFLSDESLDHQWRGLNYEGRPDMARSKEEYDSFIEILRGFGIETLLLPEDPGVGLDSIYARDASIVCRKGVILCNMGKAAREKEPGVQGAFFRRLGIPVHGAVTGTGRIEGGDVAWIDEETLAVARGYRTNDEGIRQLRELLGDCIRDLIVVPLPHWRGPEDVFHLMSILSPIDRDLALVYSPLMPVPFRDTLISRGIELVEVPDSEFHTMGCNVLALGPRKCLMLRGNPVTRARLERAGAEVHEFRGDEICIKGAGGPTCLTRPILRD